MNRAVNIFTFLILGVYSFMLMVVVYDLSISNLHLKGMPYQREIFSGLALLVLLLGLIRIQRRWQGIKDMKKYSTFKFTVPIAKKHRSFGVILTLIETAFFLGFMWVCSLFYELEPTFVIPMIVVLSLISLESLLFTWRQIKAGKPFIVGFDNNVVAYFDREIHLFYYTGLQRVELHQKDLINFSYRDDLHLSFETATIQPEDRKAFRSALIAQLEEKNIFVDDSLRNWE